MDVRDILKKYKVTLTEFAEILEVSRPTLSSYIELYDVGRELPKEKYQIVFDNLFKSGIITAEDFKKRLEEMRSLIRRDKNYGTFEHDVNSTNLIHIIMETMKKDAKSKDINENIYLFVNSLLNSYKENKSIVELVEAVLMINGHLSIEDIDDHKKVLVSNLYRLLLNNKNNSLEFDRDYFSKLLMKIKEREQEKQQKEEKIKSKIEEKINEEVDKLLKAGLDIEAIDFKEILNKIDINYEDD